MGYRFAVPVFCAVLLLAAIAYAQPAIKEKAKGSATAACRANGTVEGFTLKTANVSVLERQTGRNIAELSQSDFTVLEDGNEREIGRVARSRGPLSVSIVVDTSPSRTARLSDVARAAETILAGLAPADRFSLITFDGVINHAVSAKRVSEISGRDLKIARSTYGTRLYDGLSAALKADFGADGGRKLVILFTDGGENSSVLAGADETLALARESDITVYAVQYQAGNFARPSKYLRSLVDLTGGKLFVEGVDEAAKGIASILDDVAGRYTICYWSPETRQQTVAVRLRSPQAAHAIRLHR